MPQPSKPTRTLEEIDARMEALLQTAPEESEQQKSSPPSLNYKPQLTSRHRANLFAGGYPARHIQQADEGLTGTAWTMAQKLQKTLQERPDAMLFLHGLNGRGKTQIATYLSRKYNDPLYVVAQDYADELLDIQRDFTPREERPTIWRRHKKMRTADILVIEEITQMNRTDNTFRKITQILDYRYRTGRPVILLGVCDTESVQDYVSYDVFQRIKETGGAIHANWESYRD